MNTKHFLLSTILLSSFANSLANNLSNFTPQKSNHSPQFITKINFELPDSEQSIKIARILAVIGAAVYGIPTICSQTALFQNNYIKWGTTAFLSLMTINLLKTSNSSLSALFSCIRLTAPPLIALHFGDKMIGNTNIKIWQAAIALQAFDTMNSIYQIDEKTLTFTKI